MRFVCLSDNHKKYNIEVPDGDVLLHSGDFSFRADIKDTVEFNEWLGTLPHANKIFVPGNHDIIFDREPGLAKSLLTNAITLIDEMVEINGIKIYGTPWTPLFGRWAFMGAEGFLGKKFSGIPLGLDVLVSHGPPYGILDTVEDFIPQICEYHMRHCGSISLQQRIGVVRPKYCVFGHIHPGYGQIEIGGTNFMNAAICNDRYEPVNGPIVFDI